MKKTLSILLSLLMVLGTLTCLFTVPVTTASAEEAATEVVTESLPSNLFSKTTTTTINYDTANQYVHYNVKWSNPEQSNLSYIMLNQYHQLNFEVTASEDLGDGVIAYPVVMSGTSAKADYAMNESVGIRYDVTDDCNVEKVWDYVAKQTVVSEYEESTNEETGEVTKTEISRTATTYNDTTPALVAGKTYRYTFIFKASANCLDRIAIRIKGLSDLEAGSVTVSNPYVFNLHNTDRYNFSWDGTKNICYMVEEDGNVFTRVYAFSASHLYTNESSPFHGMTLEGGHTYDLGMDFRITTDNTTSSSPTFDYHIPNRLDYTAEFNALKEEAKTTATDTANYIVTAYGNYGNTSRGYSYFYAASGSNTRSRRIFPGLATVKYYSKADGSLVYTANETYGSGQGRNAKTAIYNKGWMNTVYTVNAPNAQSIKEAAIAGAASGQNHDQYMRYTYKDGSWTYDGTKNSFYVPAAQDEVVDFVLANLTAGSVYDFDNFSLIVDTDVVVEYKNSDGEVIELPENEAPAKVNKNVLTGELTINDHDNTDAFTFEGWYVNGELVGTGDAVTVAEDDTVKAVIVYENILTNAGGFENYTQSGQSLRVPYGTDTGDVTGKSYTYSTEGPTGDKWGYWTYFNKADATDVELIANNKHIATDGIWGGDNWFDIKVHKGITTAYYYPEGSDQGTKTAFSVAPHRGDWMLSTRVQSRQAARKIEGLEVGKTYTLSFYFYSPSTYNYLKNVAITTDYLHLDSVAYTLGSTYGDNININIGATSISEDNFTPQKWNKVEVTFKATDTYAYLVTVLRNGATNDSETFIDDMVLLEYDCKGNHTYDDFSDTQCNICGATREFLNEWTFEDGVMENVTARGNSKLEVVDAVDQPEKIGSKYLQYTTAFGGMAFNFMYEQGYKYKISYDFKVFTYGGNGTYAPERDTDGNIKYDDNGNIKYKDSHNANGIDHVLQKFDDGLYGASNQTDASLNPNTDNIVTRYYENGQAVQKVTCFNHAAGNDFYGRPSTKVPYDESDLTKGGTIEYGKFKESIWEEWQHFEIEIGTNNDYEGLVEYGIRPNGAGWVVGVDNFKVEKVSTDIIDEANNATNGTYAFNIRARTTDKKQGLRFKSTIDLDKLNLADGAKIVEYGTLAMKAELRDQGFHLVRQAAKDKALAGHAIAGIAYNEADGIDVRYAIDETTNELTYTGVLTGIGVKNYDVDFAVRGYAIIELADGTRTTVYDGIRVLSVYDAAQQIIDESSNEDDIAIAQKVVEIYNAYLAANAQ